ncbi:MAG: alginate lyase family protein [Planctomycetota bacterium]
MNWARYVHTVRHLRARQVLGRLARVWPGPRPDVSPAPGLRPVREGAWQAPGARTPRLTGPSCFRFLNEEHEIASSEDWNPPSVSRLWLYHLHSFDDWNARDAESRRAWHERLLERWVEENPPGQGVGWEPYPLSLRIANWIKWTLSGARLSERAQHSLAVQARHLLPRIETHLLGNHLLANAKALVFAGLFFQGPEAEAWLKKGLGILAEETLEQVLPDGGHVERSPMYHALVCEDLLDVFNLFTAYGAAARFAWRKEVERMLAWLRVLSHPDGEIGLLNDAAFEIALSPSELAAYAGRLGFHERTPLPSWVFLKNTGYVRLERGGAVALLDLAPLGPDYLPAHGHADTLTFELSLQGVRAVVDSGTSSYEEGPERLRQRGTLAHNTVAIDGLDSSEVWRSFRVAHRARIVEADAAADDAFVARAAHDGYARLRTVGLHRRTWEMTDEALVITDEVAGRERHTVELPFHLHPSISLSSEGEHRFGIHHPARGRLAVIEMDPSLQVTACQATYHPGFGLSVPNWKIVGRYEGPLPLRLMNVIRWASSI